MVKQHFNWLAGLFLLLSCVLTACADNTPGQPSPTQSAPPSLAGTGAAATPRPATTAAPVGFPYDCTSPKVFCFGLAQEPVGIVQGWFDPANLVDRPSLQIVRQVYETLFEYKSPSMQAQPSALLKYPPKISDNGLVYTFRIGKGLRFSDDTALDAEAVKFNFDRWLDPGNLFHHGDFQTWAIYFGGFPGKLASIEADPENNTVTLTLRQPMNDLYQILAMPQFSIVAPSAFNSKTGLMERTLGSNLYALAAKPVHSETKYVALRENELYFKERFAPNDPTAPILKTPTLVALVLKPNQDALDELRKGTIAATDKIKPEQVAEASQDKTVVLLDRPSLNLAFLGMNLLRPPFNNLSIRQALAAAIDTQSLIKNAYFGLGEPASDFLPPATVGRPAPHDPYSYDPDRARRLLDIFGYNATNPLRIDLWALPVPRAYYPDWRKVADSVVANLAQVNVIVTVRDSSAWPQFYKDHLNGTMDFYMYGWQGYNGDPYEFLGEFYGNSRGEGGYENPFVTEQIRLAHSQSDPAVRTATYKTALDALYEGVAVLPLAYVKGVVAVRPNVKGFVPNPTGVESWAGVEIGTTKP